MVECYSEGQTEEFMTRARKPDFEPSILCVFWEEDGEWIGMAQEMSITVCGDTLDEAVGHMRDGIESHLTVLIEKGRLEELRKLFEGPHTTVEDLPVGRPIFKLPVPPNLAKAC